MAFSNGPTVVTSGLVLSLDAADRNSYPGSGTTWTDISGNGNNGTLYNSPGFSSVNGGVITFDGTDDRIIVPNNSLLNFGTGPFSIVIWVSSPYNLVSYRITIQKGSGNDWSNSAGWKVTSGNGTFDLSWYWVIGNGTTHIEVPPASNFSKSNDTYGMGMFAIIRNSDNTIDRFWNGTYNQNVASLAGNVSSAGDLYIGDGYTEKSIYGNLANVSLYNKALSASEVLQNYNAVKSRYGL